ncbi:MAG: ArsR/SmtB family transcription factor [Nakamurella sp.]
MATAADIDVDESTQGPDVLPVAPLQEVLASLSDPVRLEMVRRLMADSGPCQCSQLYDAVGKSTASHHFKILREAGVIERKTIGGKVHQQLRLAELERRYPGMIPAIMAAADQQ